MSASVVHYKSYTLLVGQEFWHRLTGSESFYFDLAEAFGEVAVEINGLGLLKEITEQLSREIEAARL